MRWIVFKALVWKRLVFFVGVRSHERRNELIPVWDFKLTWKQVMFTWSFILAAFHNDPIFWWTFHFGECLQKFRSRKTPVLEFLFNKDAGLKLSNFMKKRLQHRYFPVNIAKFLRTAFLIEHLWCLLLSIVS